MYVSHPVRRIREDPRDDETVTLRVTAETDERADTLATDLASVGTVEERLRFGTLRVTVPQTRVDEVCALAGIESIETAETLTLDPPGTDEDVGHDD